MADRHASPYSVGTPPGTRYLLCRGPRAGEYAGLLTVFDTEEEARRALMTLHQDRFGRAGWAQVAAIDTEGRLTVLTWFGRPSAAPAPEVTVLARGRIDTASGVHQ